MNKATTLFAITTAGLTIFSAHLARALHLERERAASLTALLHSAPSSGAQPQKDSPHKATAAGAATTPRPTVSDASPIERPSPGKTRDELTVTIITLARGLHVKCLCFGASDTEPTSVRTLMRISLLAGVLLIVQWQLSEQEFWNGATFSAGQFLLSLACAVSIQILTSWGLALPEIVQLIKGCRTCGRQTSES